MTRTRAARLLERGSIGNVRWRVPPDGRPHDTCRIGLTTISLSTAGATRGLRQGPAVNSCRGEVERFLDAIEAQRGGLEGLKTLAMKLTIPAGAFTTSIGRLEYEVVSYRHRALGSFGWAPEAGRGAQCLDERCVARSLFKGLISSTTLVGPGRREGRRFRH